jgi:hypothetical protein
MIRVLAIYQLAVHCTSYLHKGIEARKANPATKGTMALAGGILESLTTHLGPRSLPFPYAGRLRAVRGP